MTSKSDLYTYVYFSKDLLRGAKDLLRNHPRYADLAEDLLSDTVIEVFKKSYEELFDLYSRNKLKPFIYFSMRNVVYDAMSGRNQKEAFRNYGLGENIVFNDRDIVNLRQPEIDSSDTIDISKEEEEYSRQLFGCTTKMNVQFMREIEKADLNKANNIEAWESAQITKLYFEFKSYRKVAEKTGIGYQQVRNHVQRFISTITDKKMNVTFVTHKPEPSTGMELYRLKYPYADGIHKSYSNEITVKNAMYEYMVSTPSGSLEDDVYVFSRLQDVSVATKVKDSGAKLVVDVDDYWKLHPDHPLAKTDQNKQYVENLTTILKMADLVTCTTAMLWERLYEELGITATIIKNTIPEQSQFSTATFPHTKVRIGWVGGVHHMKDVSLMKEGIQKIYQDKTLFGKFQFCLGGFNPNSHFMEYEKVMNNDYKSFKNADPDYYEYLMQLTPQLDHVSYNKSYRRLWAKPVSSYASIYNDLDIILIPLEGKQANGNPNLFNACKSELKLIEAAATGKAVICSDVMPYSPYLKNEENCLSVSRNNLNWGTQIRRLILDKDLRIDLATQLQKDIKKQFNHANETKKLVMALKKLRK